MFQTINHYSQDMLYMDVFIDEEYKLFMAKPGAKVLCMFRGDLLLAKGRRDLNVLGNCIKCIDCDTRVSVVPPGALVIDDVFLELQILGEIINNT